VLKQDTKHGDVRDPKVQDMKLDVTYDIKRNEGS
jgi:hypothetical protein